MNKLGAEKIADLVNMDEPGMSTEKLYELMAFAGFLLPFIGFGIEYVWLPIIHHFQNHIR